MADLAPASRLLLILLRRERSFELVILRISLEGESALRKNTALAGWFSHRLPSYFLIARTQGWKAGVGPYLPKNRRLPPFLSFPLSVWRYFGARNDQQCRNLRRVPHRKLIQQRKHTRTD